MTKAIFFDIDGTLVSFKTHQIPEETIHALHELRKKDIKLFIATGRHHSMITLDNIFKFDGYVTLNGQYCYNNKEVIYKQCIKKEDIEIIAEQTSKNLYACYFIKENEVFTNMVNDHVKWFASELNTKIPEVCNPAVETAENDIYQLTAFVDKKQEDMLLNSTNHIDATRWHDKFIDVTPKGGSKSVGIEAVLKYYNIPLEETMAFGDGENDITMLKHVKTGVAMGNASDFVKEAADYVTSHIDDNGLVKALEHFKIL